LLVAAAEPIGDPVLVWRAAERLGITAEAADAAESGGLVGFGARVTFRHPLVRSAIYRSATPRDRREAHRALTDATDPIVDPDRRAWHRAQATSDPDEDVADELERSAGRAQQRGGLAAAAAFLERSAELTPDPQRQGLRLLLAAYAQLMAGANDRAQALLEQSLPNLDDPPLRAQAMRMQGAIRFADGRGGETPALLFNAAMALRDVDVRMAREILMEALEAAMWAGRLSSGTAPLDVAQAARTLSPPEGDETTANLLLTGYTARLTDSYAKGVDWWRRAVRAYAEESGDQSRLRWDGMVWNATGELLDFERHSATARAWVRVAREHGAMATLPVALSGLAWCEILGGRFEAAEALISEAVEITAATGAPSMPGAQGINSLAVLAWRGREREARLLAETVTDEAVARGQGLGVAVVHLLMTKLELGLGHYEDARIGALDVFDQDPLYVGSMALGDAVEATVRTGDADAAQAALARLTERARASGTPWGLGLLARSRALLARDQDAEALYVEALEHLGRSGVATELARTHLLYGEWLRRARRRADAREHLRAAHGMFEAMGAGAFAERARRELVATGVTVRNRTTQRRDELSPQEAQIAQLARDGHTSREIGAQLFISPRTVDWHLRKVFAKLGIHSRKQLPAALPGTSHAAVPAP
jgi:DNA-binding CsgD family transcriptional regulator